MVRRLIKHFLHWLRQVLAKVRGTQHRRQHPPLPARKLPPARSPRSSTPLGQAQRRLNSTESSQPRQNVQSAADTSRLPSSYQQDNSFQPPTRAPTNKIVNASNFNTLLRDDQCSPSPAVQNLSHQLSDLTAKTDPEQERLRFTPDSEDIWLSPSRIEPDNENSASLKVVENEATDTQKEQPFIPESNSELDIASGEYNSYPSKIGTTTTYDSEVITVQGVVKLLFKLKKNNYHGYIAPHDGSKDIIFHQKYIGVDVFSRLERGMEVEVTAHITEGKAYADHVRIL